jgi:hypothetical protein
VVLVISPGRRIGKSARRCAMKEESEPSAVLHINIGMNPLKECPPSRSHLVMARYTFEVMLFTAMIEQSSVNHDS